MPIRALVFSLLLALLGTGPAVAQAPASAAPTADLPAEASTFLAEVEPLISEAERAAYLALTRPYQRQAFERRFWELRDPYPETPRNELEERFRERLRLAREDFTAAARRLLARRGRR